MKKGLERANDSYDLQRKKDKGPLNTERMFTVIHSETNTNYNFRNSTLSYQIQKWLDNSLCR